MARHMESPETGHSQGIMKYGAAKELASCLYPLFFRISGIGRARLSAGQQASKRGANSAHCPRIYNYGNADQCQSITDNLRKETGGNSAESHQACYGRRHKEGHKYAYADGLLERGCRPGPTKEAAYQWSQRAREEVQDWR